MIKYLAIIIGFSILMIIFLRRYFMSEQGNSKFLFRRKDLLKYFHNFFEREPLEITVNEMIPDTSAIDPKKRAAADSLSKRADIYLARDDMKNCEKTLIQSISLNPGSKETYYKLGVFYLRKEQFGKAEAIYRKIIMTVVDDPVCFSNLGLALYQQKKFEEAKQFYTRAIELDNTRAGRFFSLGQIHYELSENSKALEHFLKALELEPENENIKEMVEKLSSSDKATH